MSLFKINFTDPDVKKFLMGFAFTEDDPDEINLDDEEVEDDDPADEKDEEEDLDDDTPGDEEIT